MLDDPACEGWGRVGVPHHRSGLDAGDSEEPAKPWRASGRVTDPDGHPMAGVEVWASCGMGTLHRTGRATTGADGRYTMDFGPGWMSLKQGADHGLPLQAATIAAHKPGFFEANLNRQGNCYAAGAMPDDDQLESWDASKDRVIVPGKPKEIDFVMRPSGRVAGKLVDEQGKPLAGYSVSLTGPDLPPSSSVMRWMEADVNGRFVLDDVPTTYRFQFDVRKSDPKPPWDDSWASAALRFDRPDGDDLHAWFGDREVRIKEFVLRVAGPGVHGRSATRRAGNAGLLDLDAAPADVSERTDQRIVARSAVLTLRNAVGTEAGQSLIEESIPVAPAQPSPTKLVRTRPDNSGALHDLVREPARRPGAGEASGDLPGLRGGVEETDPREDLPTA